MDNAQIRNCACTPRIESGCWCLTLCLILLHGCCTHCDTQLLFLFSCLFLSVPVPGFQF